MMMMNAPHHISGRTTSAAPPSAAFRIASLARAMFATLSAVGHASWQSATLTTRGAGVGVGVAASDADAPDADHGAGTRANGTGAPAPEEDAAAAAAAAAVVFVARIVAVGRAAVRTTLAADMEGVDW